jgi:hypothetical protein
MLQALSLHTSESKESGMSESIARIDDPVVAISINGTYREGMSRQALYNSTRGTWKVNRERADRARYAFALYWGVIKEVYEVGRWLAWDDPEATLKYQDDNQEGRSEFQGHVAPDNIRAKYVGKRVPERGWGNPIRYYNC